MDNVRKRDLARAYKEREQQQGIFAIRCDASGEVWVSATRDLEKMQNQLWFGLRTGGHPNKAMQAAWNAHGEAAFRYEILEAIEDDNPLQIPLLLKERDRHWREQLKAARAVG